MYVCVYILQGLLLKRLILQGLQKEINFLCKPRKI